MGMKVRALQLGRKCAPYHREASRGRTVKEMTAAVRQKVTQKVEGNRQRTGLRWGKRHAKWRERMVATGWPLAEKFASSSRWHCVWEWERGEFEELWSQGLLYRAET